MDSYEHTNQQRPPEGTPVYGTPDLHAPQGQGADVVQFRRPGQTVRGGELDGGGDLDTTSTGTGTAVESVGEAIEGVIVDAPGPGRVSLTDRMRSGERRPVLPTWATSREQFTDAAGWVVGHIAHTTAFHAVRAPLYVGRLLVRAPIGAARLIGAGVRWVIDAEGIPVRLDVVRRADAEMYLKLIRHRDARVRSRSIVAGAIGAVSVVVLALFLSGLLPLPEVARWVILAVTVAVLGRIGSPVDKPITSPAVVAPQVARLTSEVVVRALGALGIAEINKAIARNGARGITFPAPITRDGPGWRADVDLPFGVTVADIIARREALASGLRRSIGSVWPEPAHEQHAGRLVLWVGDVDMVSSKPSVWPLAKTGTADVFKPIPFGVDQRGRLVTVTLMYSNVLIGAMPGAGKTFAIKPLALAAALDPTTELHVYELKGSGDLSPTEHVAHRYASGVDDPTIETCVHGLREVHKTLETRAKIIQKLPRDVCPENKVTPALARRPGSGLHPLVVVIDECQELFSHNQFGKEAGELCTAIIKRGRALGVILILATQRPDRDSLPTAISANVGIRFCMRVMGQVENDMILGTSAYRNGLRATIFTKRDTGIGYLIGDAEDPQITRTAYIDGPTGEKIALRARAARLAAGRLSGHATGEDTTAVALASVSLLDDLLTVFPPAEEKTWSEVLVAALVELRPLTYTGWTPEQLATAVRPYGITTAQIGRRIEGEQKVTNRRGLTRTSIETAIAERDRKRDAG